MPFLLHNFSPDNIRPAVPCDSTQPATEEQKYLLTRLYEKLTNQTEKTKIFTSFRSVNMRWYRRQNSLLKKPTGISMPTTHVLKHGAYIIRINQRMQTIYIISQIICMYKIFYMIHR